ncbi:MAG TPA: AraC family transcriptional regulator [Dialister sp.]|nr:AraC family transcriptional regulator [Dialister sp.]
MTEEEMWNAVLRCDANYDGLFFYAVKTTGIFCRPSCQSKPPKRENVLFFASAEDAQNAGFRPCKRCRSDLLAYQPLQDMAAQLRNKLDAALVKEEVPTLQNLGLTPRRLTDIFKQAYGMTPKEYIDHLRLNHAKEALRHTDKKIIDIAYETGFTSLSAFNRFFKKKTGMTPSTYRKGDW